MNRVVARLLETVSELCLVRLGIQVKSLSAWFFAHRMRSEIAVSARAAAADGAGLMSSESFAMAINHFGVLQYWRSFDDLEAWVQRPPHSEWWRKAVERMRRRRDTGVYHEAFLVPAADLESIYMNCDPAGLAKFGVLGEPVGALTTSRGRLGRTKPA